MNIAFARYMEAEVMGASPVELVHLLYRGAIESVGAARRHLAAGAAAGAIAARSRQITRAWQILQELSQTLNHEKGGQLSRNLAELYAYMQRRLIEANAEQADAPLAEAEALLTTLADAWKAITPASAPPPGVGSASPQVGLSA
jgi:flagellar protein FliS